jgi:hypothetical protein
MSEIGGKCTSELQKPVIEKKSQSENPKFEVLHSR